MRGRLPSSIGSVVLVAISVAAEAGPQVGTQTFVRPEIQITVDDAARDEPWSSRYNKALDAIKSEKYEIAIPLLKTSIAIDPVDRPDRQIAKGVTEDYFPHYHLFVAYLKTGQFAKAREYYALRGPLTLKLTAEAQGLFEELMKAEQKPR